MAAKQYVVLINTFKLFNITYRDNIFSFSNGRKVIHCLDGDDKLHPFTNSLTITNNDFSNFQHRDYDHIAAAYGLW